MLRVRAVWWLRGGVGASGLDLRGWVGLGRICCNADDRIASGDQRGELVLGGERGGGDKLER